MPEPCDVKRPESATKAPHHPPAEPVAKPAPPVDGRKPIPKGDMEVEKFNVTNDTGGGD